MENNYITIRLSSLDLSLQKNKIAYLVCGYKTISNLTKEITKEQFYKNIEIGNKVFLEAQTEESTLYCRVLDVEEDIKKVGFSMHFDYGSDNLYRSENLYKTKIFIEYTDNFNRSEMISKYGIHIYNEVISYSRNLKIDEIINVKK